jgi:hypothetical protein
MMWQPRKKDGGSLAINGNQGLASNFPNGLIVLNQDGLFKLHGNCLAFTHGRLPVGHFFEFVEDMFVQQIIAPAQDTRIQNLASGCHDKFHQHISRMLILVQVFAQVTVKTAQ